MKGSDQWAASGGPKGSSVETVEPGVRVRRKYGRLMVFGRTSGGANSHRPLSVFSYHEFSVELADAPKAEDLRMRPVVDLQVSPGDARTEVPSGAPAHVIAGSNCRLYHVLAEKDHANKVVGTSGPAKRLGGTLGPSKRLDMEPVACPDRLDLDPAAMLVAMSEPESGGGWMNAVVGLTARLYRGDESVLVSLNCAIALAHAHYHGNERVERILSRAERACDLATEHARRKRQHLC